jgi:hypothetical protein
VADRHGFASELLGGAGATKTALTGALTNPAGPPAVLFSATHGLGFERPDPQQRDLQGALVCQEWDPFEPVPEEVCFRAADVAATGNVHGLVAFCFACFGAGTPEYDEYPTRMDGAPARLAETPFVARLPQALLSHPGGGALAVIGHVERAWGCSISSPDVGPQLRPFENLLDIMLAGWPVGHAMRDFRERHAALTAELAYMLEQMRTTLRVYSDQELLANWVERNDARNYSLIGDPAVRIRVDALQGGSP